MMPPRTMRTRWGSWTHLGLTNSAKLSDRPVDSRSGIGPQQARRSSVSK